MTTEMTLATAANYNYSKLGRWNGLVLKVIRAKTAARVDMSVIADTLDKYYRVTNPRLYAALQASEQLRMMNIEDVIVNGINLHLPAEEAIALDMDRILRQVCEITSEGGA